MAICGLAIYGPSACHRPGRWVVVDVTDPRATVMRLDDIHRSGSSASFSSVVLEAQPRVMDGRLADYWQVRTTVDCKHPAYRLGATTAYSADGHVEVVDPSVDPSAAIQPGSIEATERSVACGQAGASLPAARADDPPHLLHLFRTSTLLK